MYLISTVLRLLFESSIQGTELDSSARYPPPRCYPGTRQSIIRGITDWMKNPKRAWNILWLYGFAGVGKTAIAQTVAEAAKEAHILGAAFFFSPTHKNDPVRLFVSIAYQLAASNGQYRRAVAIQLANDPGLLQKDMRTQFKKLLIEPLSQLELEKKLLIVIDGLDECHGYDEQCEIILLISKAASSPVSLPVIWMIGSRPEYHIKSTFYNADSEIDCWRKDVVVNDSETRRDIEVFIRSRFSEIMKRYSIIPKGGESWPTAGDLEKIINAVSGLFFYAATIVEFVADPYFGGPEDQLSFVISFIEDCSAKVATVNPLYYLDRLYEQILSGVPPALIHRMLQLLGIVAFYPSLPILQLANLFGYTQNRFSSITRRLYSVADIPHPDKASQDALHFFHSSFVDFLRNPARSGRFAINDRLVHLEFAKASFGVLGQATPRFAMNLAWTPAPGDISAFSVARQILYYCAANVWGACLELEDIDDPILLNMLVNFRYPFLRFVKDKIPISPFRDWIEWLTRQVRFLSFYRSMLTISSLRYNEIIFKT